MALYSVMCVIGWFITALTLLCLPAAAQSNGKRTKPSDFFWQLQQLDSTAPTGNPYIGGQNFTYCCLKAVNHSLDVDSKGNLVLLNNWIALDGNASALIEADKRGQFPCGATYKGDPNGAPVVQVNYTWLAEECPGWQRSDTKNLNAWLQPLSGFLLPAIIFCLSVPRRRKLYVYRQFFVADMAGIKSYLPALFGAIAALVLVTADTIIWLSTCFAFAGPMILSGLYEALLDSRILDFLRNRIAAQRLTLDMRCRCLMIILIGNLDLALDEPTAPPAQAQIDIPTPGTNTPLTHADPATNGTLPENGPLLQPYIAIQRQATNHLRASPWRHMEELLYGIRLFDDENLNRHLSPRQWPKHMCPRGCNSRDHEERVFPRTHETERKIKKTKTRLRTMLHCQYSFGSIVGAPVIFFLGGFIFALLQSFASLGDEDIAEGLAFGQWYMTIPHIAIVSGLLLAGNNPNILEGVFATEREPRSDEYRFVGLRLELAYPSCYKVAWQWLRGHTKRKWINKLISTYETRYNCDFAPREDPDPDMEALKVATTLSPLDWFLLLCLATLLLGVPYVLAFLTAFYTPEVGLSCRSLTFTVYAGLELAQVLLWLWAYAGPPPARAQGGRHLLDFLRRDGWLDRKGFYKPTSTSWLFGPPHHRSMRRAWHEARNEPIRTFWCALWYFLTTLFGLAAIFTALGGTLMQLMGVYSADMCYVTVEHWTRPYEERPMAVISSNSKEMISKAMVYWKPCAITAIVFMTIVSFVGWWYQRRMRDMFATLVKEIDLEDYDSYYAAAARRAASNPPPSPNVTVTTPTNP